jgi:uncharacterized protein YkwD
MPAYVSAFFRICPILVSLATLAHAADPTAQEQYWLELINRARNDPAAELARLTNYATPSSFDSPASDDPDIAASLGAFGTSAADLATQWGSLTAAAPLAWNSTLGSTADTYSALMVSLDSNAADLDSVSPANLDVRLVTNGGYGINWLDLGENLYSAAQSVLHGHAGFLIDWGDGNGGVAGYGNGIQFDAPHRVNTMLGSFKEIGIGVASGAIPPGNIVATGPVVVTQHLGNQVQGSFGSYFSNSILTGVVYQDALLGDHFYTPGEGLGAVTINVYVNGSLAPDFVSLSSAAGGFNIELIGVIAGDTVRVEAPETGLAAQTFTITSQDLSYGPDTVTFYDNIRACFEVAPVPEPGSSLLLAASLLGLSLCQRSRVSRSAKR